MEKYTLVLGASAWCNMSWKRLSSNALLISSDIHNTLAPLHHSLLVCILLTVLGMSLCNNVTLYEYKSEMKQALQRKPLIWLQEANLTKSWKMMNGQVRVSMHLFYSLPLVLLILCRRKKKSNRLRYHSIHAAALPVALDRSCYCEEYEEWIHW